MELSDYVGSKGKVTEVTIIGVEEHKHCSDRPVMRRVRQELGRGRVIGAFDDSINELRGQLTPLAQLLRDIHVSGKHRVGHRQDESGNKCLIDLAHLLCSEVVVIDTLKEITLNDITVIQELHKAHVISLLFGQVKVL